MLIPGTTLEERYVIETLLGKGGFGAVYAARELPPLRRTVAVKQTLFPDDPRHISRFEQEAELLAQVVHDALPRVYNYFKASGACFLVMEFVPGMTLAEYVTQQPQGYLNAVEALRLVEPLIDALDYLHTLNPPLIHRDIKPQNVRITPKYKVFLVDFGIAKLSDPEIRTSTLARAVTSGFSPFEQYGDGPTDARSDLYSLGATLYYMLSGVIPPDAPQRVRVDPLVPLRQLNDSVPPALEDVVKKLMAVWQDDRFQNVSEVRAALQFALGIPPNDVAVPQPVAPAPGELAAPNPEELTPSAAPDMLPQPPIGNAVTRNSVTDPHTILDQLKPNVIVSGPMFAERIQLIEVRPIGNGSVRLRGEGLRTGQVHRPILTLDQLGDLTVEAIGSFDGDSKRFLLGIEAMRLGLAYEYDRYFSLSVARVDPLPHQIEAVYDYFLKQPRIRFLLADDPGAGKTIMAGLLIKELKIRGLVQRVLIVTPANLTFQWQREMTDKFREPFEVIRSDVLRSTYGTNPWQDKNQVITSISWVSRMEDARQSLLRSRWDLVIIDEAHKMSAYSDDKKTMAYQLGEALGEMTDHYLLMTATPHKGDPENFCLFLRLLDPDVYGDVSSIEAALEQREAPFYLRRTKEALVSFPDPVTNQVKLLFTRRTVQTIEFELDAAEWEFYDTLTRYVEEQSIKAAADQSARGRALGFTMAMLQRRFASSVFAVRRSLERMKDRREKILADPAGYRQEQLAKRMPENFDELPDEEQQLILEELEQVVASVDPDILRDEIAQLARLIGQALVLEQREIESKLVKLRALLVERGIFGDPKMKLLIFTEHKETLEYLVGKLRGWNLTVTQIYGGMAIGDRDTPGSRIYAEREFRESCQVLVATEAAGEGINLQFCWLMINYDIPWNPVRLEQRMGRIHRYGQEKDCLIFNFVSTKTREGRVLQKLFDRVQEIEHALDPQGTGKVFNVLGDVFPANQLERMLRDMYARNLTEDVIKSRIVEQVDTERFRRISYSALEGLAKRELNLAAIVGRSVEAKERRLVPEVIRDFFLEAAPEAGIQLREVGRSATTDKPGTGPLGKASAGKVYRVAGRMPRALTDIGERLVERFGRLGREYKQIVFDQVPLKDDPTLEWVTPGHPLFEAVREAVRERAQDDVQRGALFFELQRTMPARLDVFAAAINDGLGHELHRRLFVVETQLDGAQAVRQPTLFLDLVPAPAGTAVPDGGGLPDREEAEQYLVTHDLQALLQSIAEERVKEITTIANHMELSLNALINRQQIRLAELWTQQERGDATPLLAANLKTTEDRLDVLNGRLERRRREVAQEQYCTIANVQHIGQAWVLPHPERTSELLAPMITDPDIERVAVQAVIAYEKAQGRMIVESVEKENRGFDLISRRPQSADLQTAGEVRFIEVKGRAGVAEVALTANEYRTADRLKDDYWLYVVYNCATKPEVHVVRDPARLEWAEVMQVAHYRVKASQILSI